MHELERVLRARGIDVGAYHDGESSRRQGEVAGRSSPRWSCVGRKSDSALPPLLPPRMFLEVARGNNYKVPKNPNLGSISAKIVLFFSPIPRVPDPCTRWAHC
jgi:hypothetical protein